MMGQGYERIATKANGKVMQQVLRQAADITAEIEAQVQ
jgi:hypothetical protein